MLRLRVNESYVASGIQAVINADEPSAYSRNVFLQATLQLKKDDKVSIRLAGHFYSITTTAATYFEGRLVTVINE